MATAKDLADVSSATKAEILKSLDGCIEPNHSILRDDGTLVVYGMILATGQHVVIEVVGDNIEAESEAQEHRMNQIEHLLDCMREYAEDAIDCHFSIEHHATD